MRVQLAVKSQTGMHATRPIEAGLGTFRTVMVASISAFQDDRTELANGHACH